MTKPKWLELIQKLIKKKTKNEDAIELTQFYPPSESIAEIAKLRKKFAVSYNQTLI